MVEFEKILQQTLSFFIKRKALVQQLILSVSFLIIVLIPIAASTKVFSSLWYELGGNFGTAAIYVLILTLIPGILKRFKAKGFLQKVQIILMLFRRQLGILAFTFALIHYAFIKLLPFYVILGETGVPTFEVFEIFGLITFWIFFLLAITSNNFSVKKLGKYWHYIHKLVYVSIWLILAHVALIGETGLAVVILIVAALETTSLIYKKLVN